MSNQDEQMHLSHLSQLGHPKQMWHFKASGHSKNQLDDLREQEISAELVELTEKKNPNNREIHIYIWISYVFKNKALL